MTPERTTESEREATSIPERSRIFAKTTSRLVVKAIVCFDQLAETIATSGDTSVMNAMKKGKNQARQTYDTVTESDSSQESHPGDREQNRTRNTSTSQD